jgi:hypothetical protein
MAESFNRLYKWELIYPQGPWRALDDVEFATLTYIDWFNHHRLHGQIEPGPGFTDPAAFEAAHHLTPSPPTRPGLIVPASSDSAIQCFRRLPLVSCIVGRWSGGGSGRAGGAYMRCRGDESTWASS